MHIVKLVTIKLAKDCPQLHVLQSKCKMPITMLGRVEQQHPSYGCTVRLAKRWLASQMLLDLHVGQESVELVVASLFLSPAPYLPPRYRKYTCLNSSQIFPISFVHFTGHC